MNKILLAVVVSFMGIFACSCGKSSQDVESEKAQKILVAYFSATGTTESVAKMLAESTGATLFEIEPAREYTSQDLDWTENASRSTIEMHDEKSRPKMARIFDEISEYDVVFLGYPNWWNQAPRIINTFIEVHNLEGKIIIPFSTSGGSGIENSVSKLKEAYPKLTWREGKLLNYATKADVDQWTKSVLAK